MRYLAVPTIVFTDLYGRSYNVKDIRPISTFQVGSKLKNQEGFDFDEIISRREYYGEKNEDMAWALADANIVKLAEVDFDTDKLKTLNIPIVESV